jgi:hypothetical protein
MPSGNNSRRAVRQVRRHRHGYCATIERRAAIAAGMIKESGWSTRQAAGAFCVNRTYLGLARKLSDDDRQRLAAGELKLSTLYKDHLRHLADAKLDRLVARYGADRIMAALDLVTAPRCGAAE